MKRKNLAFTVELLGLFILLILVITVITQVFVMSRSHSLEAKRLTEAVILAEDIAEISSTEKDVDALAGKIGKFDKFSIIDTSADTAAGKNGAKDGVILLDYVFGDGNGYTYRVRIDRKSETSDKGVYAEDTISVYSAGEIDAAAASIGASGQPEADTLDMPGPVYTLTAGKYFKEGK